MVDHQLADISIRFKNYLLKWHPKLSRSIIESFHTKGEKTSFEETIKEFFRMSDEFFLTDPGVKDFIQRLIELMGFDAPLLTCVKYAAQQITETASLPKGNPVKLGLFYQYVVLPCMQVRQSRTMDTAEFHPGLSKTEKLIMYYGHLIAMEFDKLLSGWWKYAVTPYQLGMALDKGLKASVSTRFKNHYAVLAAPDGQFIKDALTEEMLDSCIEIPLVQAFQEETRKIKRLINELLLAIPDGEEAYKKYFTALLDAIGCIDPEEVEKLWIKVDLAWVDIGKDKRVIPSHMIEYGYQHPVQISPEFRIGFRTTYHQEQINLMLEVMKEYALGIADQDGWKRLSKADAGLFYVVFSGGQGIDSPASPRRIIRRPNCMA
jgi:hypothetical protein